MKYKGYLAFDFDGVIASYNRPFIIDKLGKPQKSVIETIRYFYDQGYYILIFTGRLETVKFTKWLEKNNVPYHGVNVQPSNMAGTNNDKPFYNVIIDDKAVNFHWENNHKSKDELISEIERKLEWAKE
ncbi:MAG: hypothetical protein M0R03_13160 [Novosphingobium sp.]|nr:hypothetical protein [Novosphingobium sp.]